MPTRRNSLVLVLKNDDIKNSVVKIFAQFTRDVDPDQLSDYFIQYSVLTIDQWDRIRNKEYSRQDRCRGLLFHLFMTDHPTSFLILREALANDKHYIVEAIDRHASRFSREQDKEKREFLEKYFGDRLQSFMNNITHSTSGKEEAKLKSDPLDTLRLNSMTEILNELKEKREVDRQIKLEEEKQQLLWEKEREIRKNAELERKQAEERRSWISERYRFLVEKERDTEMVIGLKQRHTEEKIEWEEVKKQILLDIEKATAKNVELEQKREIELRKWTNERLELLEEKEKDTVKIKELEDDFTEKRRKWKEEVEQLLRDRDREIRKNREIEEQLQELRRKEMALLGSIKYSLDPFLMRTIETQQNKRIRGMTILDDELFIVSSKSSEIEVYDATRLRFNRCWKLKDLVQPFNIESSKRNACLYILDLTYEGNSNEILRIDPNGKLITKWATGDKYGENFFVTNESNILVTCFSENKLNEYSPHGQLIREIKLIPGDSGMVHLMHAIKLPNGHFVVSHGDFRDDNHRVCMVDTGGKVVKSFGAKSGSNDRQMNVPAHLAVDGDGSIMVADRSNGRVLLLSPNLNFKREILSKDKHGIKSPFRIHLDESNGRLLVADHGRLFIFNIR